MPDSRWFRLKSSVGLQSHCVVQPGRSAVDVGTMGAGKGIDVQLGGICKRRSVFFCLSVLRAVFVCNRIVPVLKPVLTGVVAVA